MEKSVDLKKIVMKHWKLWSFISIGLLIVACSKDNGNENLPPANNNFDRGAMLLNWADNIIVPAYTSFKTEAENLNNAATVYSNEPTEFARLVDSGLHFLSKGLYVRNRQGRRVTVQKPTEYLSIKHPKN